MYFPRDSTIKYYYPTRKYGQSRATWTLKDVPTLNLLGLCREYDNKSESLNSVKGVI